MHTSSSSEQVLRLLNYKNILIRLKGIGLVKVFSDNLADSLGISSSLVRKDFSAFKITGAQKGGYTIDTILERINNILGKDEVQNVILLGIGRIGEALMSYSGFEQDGIKIIAGFDSSSSKVNFSAEVPIYPMDELQTYIEENKIKIAILAVSETAAQPVTNLLDSAGIKGLLNFTPLKLHSSDQMEIRNINIGHELESLIFKINHQ